MSCYERTVQLRFPVWILIFLADLRAGYHDNDCTRQRNIMFANGNISCRPPVLCQRCQVPEPWYLYECSASKEAVVAGGKCGVRCTKYRALDISKEAQPSTNSIHSRFRYVFVFAFLLAIELLIVLYGNVVQKHTSGASSSNIFVM
jgi:hypothetical protein